MIHDKNELFPPDIASDTISIPGGNQKIGSGQKKSAKNLLNPKTLLTFAAQNPRKDAGVVDRGGLENRCALAGTQGSNPCLSATKTNQSAVSQILTAD